MGGCYAAEIKRANHTLYEVIPVSTNYTCTDLNLFPSYETASSGTTIVVTSPSAIIAFCQQNSVTQSP